MVRERLCYSAGTIFFFFLLFSHRDSVLFLSWKMYSVSVGCSMFFSFFLILYFNKPLLTIFRNSDQCFLTNYTNRIEVSVSLTSYRVLSKQQIEIKRSMSAIFHVTTAIPSLISQIIFNQSQGFPIINMSLTLSI